MAAGSLPYVSFRVYPHQIILECNENGFTSDNLEAICSVGKSSKTGAQGYIGEKGIGFKSVFIAAWKVHIQSGAFSFSFRHKTGESGMGMISPVWEETNEQLPSPMTRIILHLHETGDRAVLATMRSVIQEQFEELQETILLFMKNLQKVHVSFYDERGDQQSSLTFSIERPRANYAALKKTTTRGGLTEEDVKFFHVTTYQATNLPKNENRTYSEAEERSRTYSRSQVTIAFPLSKVSVPIIKPQELFVFLPVRTVGFSFIIQADFVTDASRQDIVSDSPRNLRLLDGVANTFVKGVLQFCKHSTLRYQWMRYLPDKNATNWGRLWQCLVLKIAECLSKTPVLYGRKRPDLRLIEELLRPTLDTLDENGEPLLDDGDPERIISQHYDGKALGVLSNYGLQKLTFKVLITWLRSDLQRGALSRMKSPETSDDWHTRVAKMFIRAFQYQRTTAIKDLRSMDLLPLRDGTWVSVTSGTVYFAQVDGLDIPSDLNLRIISQSVANPSRMLLFQHLGVQTASASFVRTNILQSYPPDGLMAQISLEISKSHLRFLYLTEESMDDEEPCYSRLAVQDHKGVAVRPALVVLYQVNDEPFGAWELFRKTDPGPNPGDGAPGYLDALFVNEEYFEDFSTDTPENQVTWPEWFHSALGVEAFAYFSAPQEADLPPAAEYLQMHRPEKFLGTMRMWSDVDPTDFAEITECLRETEVLCQGNRKVPLKDTYFMTKNLKERVESFVHPNSLFPWLWVDTEDTPEAIPAEWKSFLGQLRSGLPSTDLDFALDMLRHSVDALSDSVNDASRQQLFRLYDHIYAKFREGMNDARNRSREKIR